MGVSVDSIWGPVVVIDDKVEAAEGALGHLLGSLMDMKVPVLKVPFIPSPDDISNWSQVGLVVLDWEFESSAGSGDVGSSIQLPDGVGMPSGLKEYSEREVVECLDELLSSLFVPVFIFSAEAREDIEERILRKSKVDPDVRDRRVRIYSKSDTRLDLEGVMEEWLEQVPSLKLLRIWDQSWSAARSETFRELESASVDWVYAISESARVDGEDLGTAVGEVITRNVASRMEQGSLRIDLSGHEFVDAGVTRRVLHRRAVLPSSALSDSAVSSGDLFVFGEVTEGDDPEVIQIVVSPECDLVARGAGTDSDVDLVAVRAMVVTARKLDMSKKSAKEKTPERLARLVRSHEETTSYHALLSPGGSIYQINFKEWDVVLFGSGVPNGNRIRSGRLLEPYLSQVQRAWTSFLGRKGVPALTDVFFASHNGDVAEFKK